MSRAKPPAPPVLPVMPYALDLNLGRAYNEAMDRMPADAWALYLDHDMMATTRAWYRQMVDAICFQPEAGAIVAITNRIAAPWQKAPEADPDNHDIGYHSRIGAARLRVRTLLDITETKGFGGVMFAVSRRAWREVGGFAEGLLCVDHSIHFRMAAAGRRNYLHEGLYVYHRRRAFVGELPADTPRVPDCPCRGPEPMPTRRVEIPWTL